MTLRNVVISDYDVHVHVHMGTQSSLAAKRSYQRLNEQLATCK